MFFFGEVQGFVAGEDCGKARGLAIVKSF